MAQDLTSVKGLYDNAIKEDCSRYVIEFDGGIIITDDENVYSEMMDIAHEDLGIAAHEATKSLSQRVKQAKTSKIWKGMKKYPGCQTTKSGNKVLNSRFNNGVNINFGLSGRDASETQENANVTILSDNPEITRAFSSKVAEYSMHRYGRLYYDGKPHPDSEYVPTFEANVVSNGQATKFNSDSLSHVNSASLSNGIADAMNLDTEMSR